jgi:outer membrane murein-binding lipoprotein Lpp
VKGKGNRAPDGACKPRGARRASEETPFVFKEDVMKKTLTRLALVALAALILFQTDAQSQRRRTSRRTTHPARPQHAQAPNLPDEPAVVSTAGDAQPAPTRRTGTRTRQQQQSTQAENDQLRGTVRDLSGQVEQLSGQLNQMKADQRAMFELERLTRAEQRAEQLRTQLREVTDKEFQLQERLAEIAYESQPDAIQRRSALIGSLNPSAVRDAIAQQLERERLRINKQLELLGASHTRLEASVNAADAEVERLRQRVEAADQAQQLPPTPGTEATNAVTPTPQPSPTPTPAQPPELP